MSETLPSSAEVVIRQAEAGMLPCARRWRRAERGISVVVLERAQENEAGGNRPIYGEAPFAASMTTICAR